MRLRLLSLYHGQASRRPRPIRHSAALLPSIFFSAILFIAPQTLPSLLRIPNLRWEPPQLTILVVSDSLYREKYRSQFASVECYSRRHNYAVQQLDPNIPECNHVRNFYFRKHCAVATWLTTKPQGATVVVLDGDVVPGAPGVSLSRWLSLPYDMAFYERSFDFEIVPGNYIVRNTKFTRTFLNFWVRIGNGLPTGYTSGESEALHMALLEALSLNGRRRCRKLYDELQRGGSPQSSHYRFIACVKWLLGPARTMHALRNGTSVGTITVFQRLFGFAVDARVHGFSGYRNFHALHHGVSDEAWEKRYIDYADGGTVNGCTRYTLNETVSDDHLATRLREADKYAMEHPAAETSIVPRFRMPDETCYERLWCPPLREKQEFPGGYVTSDGHITAITFREPGVDSDNVLAKAVL